MEKCYLIIVSRFSATKCAQNALFSVLENIYIIYEQILILFSQRNVLLFNIYSDEFIYLVIYSDDTSVTLLCVSFVQVQQFRRIPNMDKDLKSF